MDEKMTGTLWLSASNDRKAVKERKSKKGKQEERKSNGNLKFHGLAHKFNFISERYLNYNCAFKKSLC